MAEHPPKFETRHRMGLALERSGMQVIEIARELGISRTTVSNYLNGRTQPQRGHLIAWSYLTRVPLEWLVDGTEPEPEPEPDPPTDITPKRRRKQAGNTGPWITDPPIQPLMAA